MFRFSQFGKDAKSKHALRAVAVLAAASTDSFDQAFAAANASTLISSAGFIEREFQPIKAAVDHHTRTAMRNQQRSVHAMPARPRLDFTTRAEKRQVHWEK